MADRIERLREAAQARHTATLRRAEAALRSSTVRGEPVTLRRLAEEAGVSRSWLYRQPQLRHEIDLLRGSPTNRERAVPDAQRATVDSLRQQVHAYREEIARLREENQVLREQLSRHLGTARAASVTTRS